MWTTIPNNAAPEIASNQCRFPSDPAAALYNGITWPNDQRATAKLINPQTYLTDNGPGLCVRAASGANTMYFAMFNGNGTQIYKVVADNYTQIASSATEAADNDICYLEAIGTRIAVGINGVEVATATDSAISSGSAGIFGANEGDAGPIIEDWAGSDFATSEPTVTKSKRSDPYNHPALGPYSKNKVRLKRHAVVAFELSEIDVSATSDFEAETVLAVANSISSATSSDFEMETTGAVANSISANANSDFETESVSSVSITIEINTNSDFESESTAIANNSVSVSTVSDFEVESSSAVAVGISCNSVSNFESETIAQVTNPIDFNGTSDFEAETESFVDVFGGLISVTVISDFEAESVAAVSTSVTASVTSDFETETAAIITINIGSISVSDAEFETVAAVLNLIAVQVSSDFEAETLSVVDVDDAFISVSAVSTFEAESAISVLTTCIAEIISDIQIESVISVDVEETSTSFEISNRFDRQIKSALKMITKYGQKVVWRIITETQDVSEPWKNSAQTVANHTVSICFLPTNKQELESIAFRAGIEVPKGCVLGYMGAQDFEPNLKDAVVRQGVKLSIFYIDKLSPNGQNLLYTLLLKE